MLACALGIAPRPAGLTAGPLMAQSSIRAAPLAFRSPGAEQTPARPHRIVSLIPAVTEMLFAIGAGADVIGVSSYDAYPPEVASRARVGGLIDPDFERILSLKPDLVIVYGTQSDLAVKLGRSKIPMFETVHAGLADITTTIRSLGARVGRVTEAEQVASGIERDLADIRRRVGGQPRPRTLLVFERESGTLRGIYASAGIGFLHDMLEVAGGTDVFADVARQSIQASTEQILSRAPDAIIEVRTGEGHDLERTKRELDSWRTLPSLPAVRNGRLYLFTDGMIAIPGPRVAEAVRLIAKALHPNQF
jgi:iron complex transport system substrate-binding protein